MKMGEYSTNDNVGKPPRPKSAIARLKTAFTHADVITKNYDNGVTISSLRAEIMYLLMRDRIGENHDRQ